jgi:hypothetical protein
MQKLSLWIWVLFFGLVATPLASAHQARELQARIDDLQRQIDELKKLKEEVQALKVGQGAKETELAQAGIMSRVEPLLEKVKLGGYGSFRFEGNGMEEIKDTFTLRRFVLTTDARPFDRLRIYSEIEYERFTQFELERENGPQAGGFRSVTGLEGTGGTELSMEQMWFQYDIIPSHLGFRIGEILVPLGRFNIHHDDNQWEIPRRTLVDRQAPVLPFPSAWPELGLGLTGETSLGEEAKLGYELYLMNGVTLEAETEIIAQTRNPRRDKLEIEAEFFPFRGTADLDSKNAKAVAGRLSFSPALGWEIGLSGYFGRYTPDWIEEENNIRAFGLDGLFSHGAFELEGEFIYTSFDDLDSVARGFARVVGDRAVSLNKTASPTYESEIEIEMAGARTAERRYGFWLESRYRFWPELLNKTFLGKPFENPQMIGVLRLERVVFNDALTKLDFKDGVITELKKENLGQNRITVALSYRPVPLIAVQLALEHSWQGIGGRLIFPRGTAEDRSTAFLFGVAFGF